MTVALSATIACDPFRPAFREKILEGQRFAHYLRFPSGFKYPRDTTNFNFDHLGFRIASSPGILIVAGCGYPDQDEVFSSNAFLIDTAHEYAIIEAQPGDWQRSTQILGAEGWRSPREYGPPSPVIRISSTGLESGETSGFKFHDQIYSRRGDWITNLGFNVSANGKLVVLAGVDKRKLPSTGVFLGSPASDGLFGNYTIDVFDADQQLKLAALDVDCNQTSVDCMAYITAVNSRWFAIALARNLSEGLLFDFGPERGKESK
jgi:hypothetical protein